MQRPARVRARLGALSPTAIQLVRFALVGGLGTLSNLVLFYFLVDRGGTTPMLGLVVCFALAVTQNYALNELWTFATEARGALSLTRYWKFIVASLAGLATNAAVLVLLLASFEFALAVIPQGMGIAAGMLVNFVASRHVVFRRSR